MGIKASDSLVNFDALPDSAMVGVDVVALVLGQSVRSVWRESGRRLPKPVKVGPATTRWNVGEIRRHLAALAGQS